MKASRTCTVNHIETWHTPVPAFLSVRMAVATMTYQLPIWTRRCLSAVLLFFPGSLIPVSHSSHSPETIESPVAKNIAVVIQEDPRKTHRPVEALRIALGLASGSHTTSVVLLHESVRLLTEPLDDIIDVDLLETYLPSIEHLDLPFILDTTVDRSALCRHVHIRYETHLAIGAFIRSMDCALVF